MALFLSNVLSLTLYIKLYIDLGLLSLQLPLLRENSFLHSCIFPLFITPILLPLFISTWTININKAFIWNEYK